MAEEAEGFKPKSFLAQFESFRARQVVRPRHNGKVEYELKKNGEVYIMSVELRKGKKEGPAGISLDGLTVADLNFVSNQVNGEIMEYEDTIPVFQGYMKNGLREGIGTEWNLMGDVTFFGIYHEGEKAGSLVPSQLIPGFYDCYDNKELKMICQIEDNKFRGLCCIFEHGVISSVVEYLDNMTAYPKKKFDGTNMKEYEDNILVYDGEYANDISRFFPREGNGVMFKNGREWYSGEWKNDVPNGNGTLHTDEPVEGDWERGYCKTVGDAYVDYKTGETEEVITKERLTNWKSREPPVANRTQNKHTKIKLNIRLLVISIAVILAVILGIIIIVAIVNSRTDDTEYVVTTVAEFNAIKYQAAHTPELQ